MISNEPKMHEQVRKTILLFLGILTLLSAICYYAILKLNPTSIYVGALMMCPALSALITLKLVKRPISSLPWGLKSLWPAALFHSVHNIFIQKIFTPLTITNDSSPFWIDKYGLMLPIITTLFAIYFWRKAKVEHL